MEAVQGCRKTITYEADTFCGTCNGSGVPPGTVPKTCKTCKGSGVIFMQKGIFTVECTCSICNGSGKIVKNFCKTCKGEQVVKGKMSVKLDIMAGIDDNDTMKVFGKGGADVERNKPGDLYVTIKVREDPIFRREGNHVHVDSVLSISQRKNDKRYTMRSNKVLGYLLSTWAPAIEFKKLPPTCKRFIFTHLCGYLFLHPSPQSEFSF
jgi:molecular chaperone DnaJ